MHSEFRAADQAVPDVSSRFVAGTYTLDGSVETSQCETKMKLNKKTDSQNGQLHALFAAVTCSSMLRTGKCIQQHSVSF